jgi:hypothetical protein
MTRSKIIITILVFTILSVLATLPFTRLKGLMPGYHTFVYTPEKYEDVKTSVQSQNKKDLAYIIDKKLLPYWLGTTWNFNGTTQVPGEGSIACGYFVTTLLRDAGVKLERVKLAQMASEDMMKILCKKEHIKRYHNTGINDFVSSVKKQGYGLYVVGLDLHTGFVLCDSASDVYFIHSSGIPPYCVVKEAGLTSPLLINSAYRVLGKL